MKGVGIAATTAAAAAAAAAAANPRRQRFRVLARQTSTSFVRHTVVLFFA